MKEELPCTLYDDGIKKPKVERKKKNVFIRRTIEKVFV